MAVDYEKEYDNRARVPEHGDIFARWHSEAQAYRAASPRAELGLSYGHSPRQFVDFFPAPGENAKAPLALFVHGGWWRTLHPSEFSQMAAGPNANGIDVAVTGYDLCPQVSIAAIVEQIRNVCLYLWRRHRKRIFVYGHSAGGHLAGAMLAQDWKTFDASAPADLVPAAYSISGVFDLAPLVHVSQNADLRLDAEEARRMSPIYWKAPTGLVLDAVVGGIESGEFLRQSHVIVDTWGAQGVTTRYEEIAGANHFDVLDQLTQADSAMTRRVVELARKASALPP